MPIATWTVCSLLYLSETTCLAGSFTPQVYRSRHPPLNQRRRQLMDARIRIKFSLWGRMLNGENDGVDFAPLEKQVVAAAHAQMDANSILNALDAKELTLNENLPQDDYATTTPLSSSPWKIALAASLLCSGAVLVLSTYNLLLAGIIGLAVFVIALADPVEDDSLAGAFARMVGRITIRSVEASQPKVKAFARAVVTGQDEVVRLKQRIKDLEDENADLKRWKDRRTKADDRLGDFSLTALKEQARSHALPVGGTKMELLIRLVDAGVIDL